MASRLRASTRMRNSVLVLNLASAVAPGTMARSSVLMPSPPPLDASTPMTRKRRSPTRTNCPSAGPVGNSSARSLAPITISGDPRFQSSRGRKRPCASLNWRTSMNSAVVPSTMPSRRRPPADSSEVPAVSGATRATAGARSSACASSTVRSRGVLLMKLPGLMPPVSARPGSTITRLLPMALNSRTT